MMKKDKRKEEKERNHENLNTEQKVKSWFCLINNLYLKNRFFNLNFEGKCFSICIFCPSENFYLFSNQR